MVSVTSVLRYEVPVQAPSALPHSLRQGLRRGFVAGVGSVLVLAMAALPSRLSQALHGWGSVLPRVERLLAGALLDLSAALLLLAPLVALLTLAMPLLVARSRGARWQHLGGLVCAAPLGFLLWLLTVIAQEVKSERGAFPTVFDLAEGGTNAAFVTGAVGFFRYERIWLPALVGVFLAGLGLFAAWRRQTPQLVAWGPWTAGVLGGLLIASATVLVGAAVQAQDNRFGPAALGDPLTGILESSVDLLSHRGPATPRQLVLTAELPPALSTTGAERLGWPPSTGACAPHPHARPLDPTGEPALQDPTGRALLAALTRLSQALFADDVGPVAVFQLSLEGFRADDLRALNPAAPAAIAPFVNGLYEAHRPGVLVSPKMFQAGVRTAHGVGAMLCGLGTLPYNLSFIRDLQPVALRCLPDLLADAGFEGSFYYGSDASFDEMRVFLEGHGYPRIVSQAELPASLPKGTWGGFTDFVVFDRAVDDVAQALEARGTPQHALVMSLSNHSPFTTPEDLPAEVTARVDRALAESVNRADADDRRRLVAYSYTDAAVERLFARLESQQISDRSIVVLAADHSTGHGYIWGKTDPESDAAKAQIPFAIVIPPAFLARAKDRPAVDLALAEIQGLLDQAPLSQNDVPAMLLAVLRAQPALAALPQAARWHTLGGQVLSPYFRPGGDPSTSLLGINGVSELFALDRAGVRVGPYEDSVFLKTRADRYRVTPRLIPVTATLRELLRCADQATARAASVTGGAR